MKITEYLTGRITALSFEFFPPRTAEQEEKLYDTLGELVRFSPDFVSVTYGALGTNRGRAFFWAREIKEKFGIDPVAHLTGLAATRADVLEQLNYLQQIEVENILALRGDPPADQPGFVPPADGFKHADELIRFIKEKKPHFCVGAAGYPEVHPQAASPQSDIEYLKRKVDAGAEFIITQLFFDNRVFFDFMNRCRMAGIYVPVIPGLMPITSFKQIKKLTEVCGAKIPPQLLKKMEENQHDPAAISQIGIDQTLEQCCELMSAGVPGLHFFVMNQAGPISRILETLKR